MKFPERQDGNRPNPPREEKKWQVDMTEPAGERSPYRLAPWTAPGEKPCYLSTEEGGFLSAVADLLEAEQLEAGTELLEFATELLSDEVPASDEVRSLACLLCEALRSALRIAASRGARLPVPSDDTGTGTDGGGRGGGSRGSAEDAV